MRWILILIFCCLASCRSSKLPEEGAILSVGAPQVTSVMEAPSGEKYAASPSPRTVSLTPTTSPVPTSSPRPLVTWTPLPSPMSSPLPPEMGPSSPYPTSIPWSERSVIGYSALDKPLEVVRLGVGDRWFMLVGALHGGHECNTYALLEGIIKHLGAEPSLLPKDVALYAIPVVNPDGCLLDTRENANGVDLNRNWDTDDWVADAEGPGGVVTGSGGAGPFSEPETIALRSWLLQASGLPHKGPLTLISYHSAVVPTGLVQPGFPKSGAPDQGADDLALTYADAAGYRYSRVWIGNYEITGELIHWASMNGIIAIDVELPDRNRANTVPVGWSETHIETNLRALLAVLAPEP